ncbi:MAG: recombinase family protein [Akkermansiaceae bacterium]|nr:recombinase family protein [Akkermansiaceae bacterium]MCF7730595.1 recombinase family protein [Akkermansiaceae bacterium]
MKTAKLPVAILVRVSTLKQENDRQISELQGYADAKGYEVVEVCQEQISGNADEASRHGLHRVEELARIGAIKKVLVHEVSRLARRNSIAHAFVETLEECGVSLYWHQQAIETLLPNGKRNPAAAIMFALLAEMARAERETLSERIRSGLKEARRKGRRLGRPKGSTVDRKTLLAKHSDIVRRLKEGHSVRNTAKITGKGGSTVQRVKELLSRPVRSRTQGGVGPGS